MHVPNKALWSFGRKHYSFLIVSQMGSSFVPRWRRYQQSFKADIFLFRIVCPHRSHFSAKGAKLIIFRFFVELNCCKVQSSGMKYAEGSMALEKFYFPPCCGIKIQQLAKSQPATEERKVLESGFLSFTFFFICCKIL